MSSKIKKKKKNLHSYGFRSLKSSDNNDGIISHHLVSWLLGIKRIKPVFYPQLNSKMRKSRAREKVTHLPSFLTLTQTSIWRPPIFFIHYRFQISVFPYGTLIHRGISDTRIRTSVWSIKIQIQTDVINTPDSWMLCVGTLIMRGYGGYNLIVSLWNV